MKGWLQKFTAPQGGGSRTGAGRNLPAQRAGGAVSNRPRRAAPQPAGLPNATVIYGIGASLMFVAVFFLLAGRHWFSAAVVFALGICLLGFALHLLKHQD